MVDYSSGGTNIPLWLQAFRQPVQRQTYGGARPSGVMPSPSNAAGNNQNASTFGGGTALPTGGSGAAPLTINSNGISFTDPNNPLRKVLGQMFGGFGGDSSQAPGLNANGAIVGAQGPTSVGGAPLVGQSDMPPLPPRPAVSPQTAQTMSGQSAMPLTQQQPFNSYGYSGTWSGGQPSQPQAPTDQTPYGPPAPATQPQNGFGQAGVMGLINSSPTSGPQVPVPQTPDFMSNPIIQALMGGGA